jgi:copper chaperone CopZ
VSTAEAVIAQELYMLPGVRDIGVDPRAGAIFVVYQPDATSEAELAEALEEIGYPRAS